jgi:hypothetical protein
MMSKTGFESVGPSEPVRFGPAPAELSEEDKSKDAFFVRLAGITEEMIAKHGKEFAMGTLVLSARFVAENRPLTKKPDASPRPHVHKHDGSCCQTESKFAP